MKAVLVADTEVRISLAARVSYRADRNIVTESRKIEFWSVNRPLHLKEE